MSLTLLIVDDDQLDRLAVRRALRAAGVIATIHEADGADRALELVRAGAIDCVLLDYRLAGSDGVAVLRGIRALGLRTPVIALTGQGGEDVAVEMMKAGAADYLSKQSLTPDRLERSIRHAIAIAAAEAERERLTAREQAALAEARAANRAKDEFLATLSHELRTPLNAILGWVRLLAGGTLDAEKTARAIATIERNTLAQAKLIEDLLDISRVVTGKVHLELAPLDLSALIEGAVETLRPTAAAKHVALGYAAEAPRPVHVIGDSQRLQQVIGNLLGNAVKFTPEGGQVTVTLRCDNGHATVIVRDTGIGIDGALLPKVFDRFQQGESGAARQHGGLGLGLAIAHHLVKMHGGELTAASEGRNRGATFSLAIPLAGSCASAGGSEGRTAVADVPSLAGVHVLALDDNADSLALMEAVLAACGARVSAATSVAEALQIVGRDRPDVVLSDIAMPGDDGYALIHALRASPDEAVRALPAAAITAYASAQDRARLLAAGFQAHLAKPVDPNELAALARALIGGSAADWHAEPAAPVVDHAATADPKGSMQ